MKISNEVFSVLRRACIVQFLFLMPFIAITASAQAQLQLQLETALQITYENGAGDLITSYEATNNVQPDAILRYTISFLNTGTETATNASLVGVIPENAVFLETLETDTETDVRFSADQGETYAVPPLTISVLDENGISSEIEAGPETYTHIRFTLTTPIAAGASGSVRYLVKIN